ncbi:MAG TPA: AI-2E family transporter [Streptosporangiaceae bacterium]|jgi:predicted PurR-regulated permease PerM
MTDEPTPDTARPANTDALGRAARTAGRLLVLAIAVGAALWALWELRVVAIPVIIAVFIATLLQPPARWLRDHGVHRSLATLIVCLGALVVAGGVITLLIQPTVAGFDQLASNVGSALDQLQQLAGKVGLTNENLQSLLDQAKKSLSSETVIQSAATAGEIVVGFVVSIVLAIYFTHDGDRMVRGGMRFIPRARRRGLEETLNISWHVIGRYVRGVAIVGLADSLPIAVVLLVLGVPLVVPLAVITFVAAFLPVVGAFLSGAVAVLVTLVTKDPLSAVIVLAAFVLVQQLESHILAPQVYGRSLELHPVVILLAITLGSVVAGIIGAFLAAPVAAVIGALLRRHADDVDDPPEAGAAEPNPPPGGADPVPEGAPPG